MTPLRETWSRGAFADRGSDARMPRMSSPAKNEMDVDAFLVWAEGRHGRWELRDGQPVMMAPERAAHALTKYAAQNCSKRGHSTRGTALPHVSRTA